MKKVISLLVIVMLMAALATTAFASEELELVVNVVDVDLENNQVIVEIAIANNPGFASAQFDVKVDEEHFELTALEYVGDSSWVILPVTPNVSNGRVGIVAIPGNVLGGDCVLARATLTIKDGILPGEYPVKVINTLISDASYNKLVDHYTQNTDKYYEGTIVIPCTAHEWMEIERVAPTCMEPGKVVEKCQLCGEIRETELEPAHTNVIYVPAVAPTCDTDGNMEYWYCADCGMVYLDEALTIVSNMKNVIIPAAHTNVIHVEAKAPSCFEDGNVEYWYCADCGMVYLDADLTIVSNMKNVVLPAAHTGITYVAAKEPSCFEDGNVEYWYCADCGSVWLDEELTKVSNMKNVIIPAAHTGITHVDAKEPTCVENGNVEYWYCADCGSVWLDEELTKVSNMKNVVIPALGHGELSYTDNDDGFTHTVKCLVCNEVLDDAEAHVYEGWTDDVENPGWKYQECVHCHYINREETGATGDNSVIAVVLATLSMMGIALVVSKKKF